MFDHGYALLIAVDQSAAPLPDVLKDVTALRDVLLHPQRCGYRDENVKCLTGAASTRDGILDELEWLGNKLGADPDATAIVYFSGHGTVQEGQHYLVPSDVNLKRIAWSSLPATAFAAEIAKLRPRRLFVALDCCHAAGMGVKDLGDKPLMEDAAIPPDLFMAGEKGIPGGGGTQDLADLADGIGRVVLSSCRPDERSYLRPDRKMSIFTWHLIEALTGHAEPKAGAVDVRVSDVIGHLDRNVPASAKPLGIQRPWSASRGNFPIALLLGGKGLGKGELAPDPLALPPSSAPAVSYHATATGNHNAIAQGKGAVAMSGGVHIGGHNSGRVNAGGTQINVDTGGGSYIGGDVNTGGGQFVGRNATVQHPLPPELAELLETLLNTVAAHAPVEQQTAAAQQVEALQAEIAMGPQADDSRLAGIVDGLAAMVPAAVSAVVSLFATPVLQGIVGPVTKFVLAKLAGK